MKTTFRIPTTDQYAYIEIEMDGKLELDEIKSLYQEYTATMNGEEVGPGLTDKEFNAVYDAYRIKGTIENGAEVYGTCNKVQQEALQQLKRSFARTK